MEADFWSRNHGNAEWQLDPAAFASSAILVPSQRRRPFRYSRQCSAPSLRQLEARAIIRRYRRIFPLLGRSKRLCLPTICSHRSGAQASISSAGQESCLSGAAVERRCLVPSSPQHSGSRATTVAVIRRSSAGSTPGASSADGVTSTPSDSMSGVRTPFFSAGLPESVSALLMASWRGRTAQHYDSAWARWWRWCSERQVDPLCPLLKDVLVFLSSLFDEGRAYRTIGVYRSALSSTLPPIDGSAVGSHPLVVRLLKGVYNSRPPAPRYTHTWDVQSVLSVMQSCPPPPKELSDKQLTLRLVMLLALTGTTRADEVRKLSSVGLVVSADSASITLLGPTKTQRVGEPLKRLGFSAYTTSSLCPVTHIVEYAHRPESWHPSDRPAQFLLSFRKPHGPVKSPTMARWFKEVLKYAGIDPAFLAHSTRSASTSAAAGSGLSTDIIYGHSWLASGFNLSALLSQISCGSVL